MTGTTTAPPPASTTAGSTCVNHAVTIVGWDDAYSAANFAAAPPGHGAWLVKNSWGTGWGQSGYFWVSYYDRYCGTSDVFNAVFEAWRRPTNYSDIYSYDPLGQTDTVGYGSATAWGANVFTAKPEPVDRRRRLLHARAEHDLHGLRGRVVSRLCRPRAPARSSTPGFHTVDAFLADERDRRQQLRRGGAC